jgi:hypothetical protein
MILSPLPYKVVNIGVRVIARPDILGVYQVQRRIDGSININDATLINRRCQLILRRYAFSLYIVMMKYRCYTQGRQVRRAFKAKLPHKIHLIP